MSGARNDEVTLTQTGSPVPASGDVTLTQASGPHTGHLVDKAEWNVGDVIDGRYEILSVIGRGGMGVVYRTRHLEWDMDMAVKCPLPALVADPTSKERYLREALTWVDLGLHPHIVQCWFVRELGGIPRLFMDHVGGGSLKQWFVDGRIRPGQWGEIIDLCIQACDGLGYAHARGIVHRDVKPANMLMHENGRLCVTDFGLVKLEGVDDPVAGPSDDPAPRPGGSSEQTVTTTGSSLGTPEYGAPEQWGEARHVDARADVYALGGTLFELCCGRRAFDDGMQREPPHVLIGRHLSSVPPRPSTIRPDIPAPLEAIALACMEKDPASRPASMSALRTRLEEAYSEVTGCPYDRSVPVEADLRTDSLNNRAISLWELGEHEKAFSAWKEARAIDSHHLASVYNFELQSWRTGSTTDLDATTRLEAVHARGEARARHAYLRAQLALERGDLPRAIDGLSEAVDLMPSERAYARALEEARQMVGSERIWRKLEPALLDTDGASGLAFHAGTRRLLVSTPAGGTDDSPLSQLLVVDLSSEEVLFERQVPVTGAMTETAFSPDGDSFVLLTMDGLDVFSLTSGETPRHVDLDREFGIKITTTPRPVLCPDGTVLAVREWTTDEPASVQSLPPDAEEFRPLYIEQGGRITTFEVDFANERAVTCTNRGHASVWYLQTGFGQPLRHGSGRKISYASFSPDGSRLMAVVGGTTVSVLAFEDHEWKQLASISTHPELAVAAALDQDNAILVTWTNLWSAHDDSSVTRLIRLWDMAAGRCLRTIEDVPDGVFQKLAFTRESDMLFAYATSHGARAWSRPASTVRARLEICRPVGFQASTEASHSAEARIEEAWSAYVDGQAAKACSLVRAVQEDPDFVFHPKIVEILDGLHAMGRPGAVLHHRCTRTMAAKDQQPPGVIRFVDADTLISGTSMGAVQVWDLSTGETTAELVGHFDRITQIHVVASGRIAVSLDSRPQMRTWDLETMQCISRFDLMFRQEKASHLAVSDDGTRAFSVEKGGRGVVWDLEIEEVDDVIELDPGLEPASILFRPHDSETVHIRSTDGSWTTLDLRTARKSPEDPDRTMLPWEHEDFALVLDDDGVVITNRLEDEVILRLPVGGKAVSSAVLSRDARHMLTGDESGMIRHWELDWEIVLPQEE